MIYDKNYAYDGSKSQASQKNEGQLGNTGSRYDAKEFGEIDNALKSNSRLADDIFGMTLTLRERLQQIMKQHPKLENNNSTAGRSYTVPMAKKIENNNFTLSNAMESMKSFLDDIDVFSQ